MKNLKDTLSTICAIAIAIGSVLSGVNVAVLHWPGWVTGLGAVMFALGTAVIGVLTGKNPDGSTKTQEQINAQINPPANSAK